MTDADPTPFTGFEVRVYEDQLLPLRQVEYDIRSAARLVGFAVWLGLAVEGEPNSQLLDPETIDHQPVRRIHYGSPLEVVIEVMPYAIGYAYAVLPLVEKLLRAIGHVRKDFAEASESNARRDEIRDQTDTRRSERQSRENRERFESFREAAADLLRNADDNEEAYIRHLILQAQVDPKSLDDSIDSLIRLSEKRVDFSLVTTSHRDNDDYHGPAA